MKRCFIILITLTLSTCLVHFHSQAKEPAPLPYFGIGATIQDMGSGEFLVTTKGTKAEEGFVFSPKEVFDPTKINFSITLKGTGTVILRISETDARGRFIKEKELNVQLENNWKTYDLPFELETPSSQIDALVLTKAKEKSSFYFKHLQIQEQEN